jgi:hypothetical protein
MLKMVLFEITYFTIVCVSGLFLGYYSIKIGKYYIIEQAGIMLNMIFNIENGYYEL